MLLLLLFISCSKQPKLTHPGEAFKAENWQKTVDDGVPWISAHPKDIQSREMVGKAALTLNDSILALEVLSPSIKEIQDIKLKDRLLSIAQNSGRLGTARTLLEMKIRTAGPKRAELTQQLAVIERRIHDSKLSRLEGDKKLAREDWLAATRLYRDGLKIYSGDKQTESRLNLARAELLVTKGGTSKAEKALSLVDHSKQLTPSDPLPWYIEGDILMKLGEEQKGLSALQKAVDMNLEEPFAGRAAATLQHK